MGTGLQFWNLSAFWGSDVVLVVPEGPAVTAQRSGAARPPHSSTGDGQRVLSTLVMGPTGDGPGALVQSGGRGVTSRGLRTYLKKV